MKRTAGHRRQGKRPAVLALDGGGSKVDAALVARDGSLIGAARWPGSIYDGFGARSERLDGLAAAVAAVCRDAGIDPERLPLAPIGVFAVAGADLPADERRILRGLLRRGWTTRSLLRNDTFAVLRAGTERAWGVGVVCGFGTNCAGVAPDGRTFRFPAVGSISGDWGGGVDIGREALWYAMRAQDGRGERTLLATLVPEHFGLRRPRQVMEAIHLRKMGEERVVELPPVVFRAAAEGDAVARRIVDRQADEVVAMAGTAIRRLGMSGLDVHVVLGGGIFRNRFGPFFQRIEEGLRAVAPDVRVMVLTAPPVVGAALIGLDQIGSRASAKARLRAALTHKRLRTDTQGRREGIGHGQDRP